MMPSVFRKAGRSPAQPAQPARIISPHEQEAFQLCTGTGYDTTRLHDAVSQDSGALQECVEHSQLAICSKTAMAEAFHCSLIGSSFDRGV